MNGALLTIERLKSHLNTNQAARERLCADLLSLIPNYSNIRPRHPQGGRDGGIDIDMTYFSPNQAILTAASAISFMNDAEETNDAKVRISRKFRSDCQKALSEKHDLKAFVFFTNINFTHREKIELIQYANTNGIEHCEIIDREIMRLLLHQPMGLIYREIYLDIPINNGLEDQLDRIEFLLESNKPTRSIYLSIGLNKEYSADELGHFRIICEISNPYEPKPERKLYITGKDSYPVLNESKLLYGYLNKIDTNSVSIANTHKGVSLSTVQILLGDLVYKKTDFNSMNEFEYCYLSFYINQNLFDKLRYIGLIVNNYLIAHVEKNQMVLCNREPDISWANELCTDTELWKYILLKDDSENAKPYGPIPGQPTKPWIISFEDFYATKININI